MLKSGKPPVIPVSSVPVLKFENSLVPASVIQLSQFSYNISYLFDKEELLAGAAGRHN
jgi:hypothetical protein